MLDLIGFGITIIAAFAISTLVLTAKAGTINALQNEVAWLRSMLDTNIDAKDNITDLYKKTLGGRR